ncbi:MAG: segregation/condensation protein A [Sphingobacteriales bacterium]|nr:segregation/condensation protein A [Sphingobacteriales bacterium]MBP9140838.1 segregation/condensation protein A [Chitinophagales bacterium]MDA0199986.1 segregation/condensation protein A [Bacteroidota bacterium]MBK6891180.1 segregation/condensation protein A [Sphingobacteriales bacterium]MBK7526995.1 segregation/condensation protein A [Sphingobacteriales bacterium]
METYQIKLDQFEGPFDLLLFFIERDELDIYDIPIAKLTEDFLAYIRDMELLNIELASEFILVAATLMHIKARMLLPRRELNEAGEPIDPRQELIDRLLEYKKYKALVATLQNMAETQSLRFNRGNAAEEQAYIAEKFNTETELEALNLYKLLQVFQKLLQQYEGRLNQPRVEMVRFSFSIEDEKKHLNHLAFKLAHQQQPLPFEQIFSDCQSRLHAIFRFLALLELIQEQLLQLQVGIGFNNFKIAAPDNETDKTPNSESGNEPEI